jgi:hypothetical protein
VWAHDAGDGGAIVGSHHVEARSDGGAYAVKVLGSRVDALTLAYRVKLDPAFVAALCARAEVAKEHGRAAFRWGVQAPRDSSGVVSSRRQLGPLRARWADEADAAERVSKVWGELRYSRASKTWNIVNEPFFRLRIDLHAPGGGALVTCGYCRGMGSVKGVACSHCEANGTEEEPGWTVEIVWYAQTLADWGLDLALRESAAIAALMGDVREQRLRRIDLCADVDGWEIASADVRRLAKRPRAKWAVDDSGVDKAIDEAANVHGRGALAKRRITGISVGRGGAMMARIYDKRAEVERDERRQEAEEARWKAAGWDGEAPIARVEFQIRGVALTELGIRDPDAVVEPVVRVEPYVDAYGKRRLRRVVEGQRILTAEEDGRAVQMTIVHRLASIWSTCLDWVRLVVPEYTRGGKLKAASRLRDDPRWALLREVEFSNVRRAIPIRRYRPRAAASAAQALGVSLSQAGREGRLSELSEERVCYDDGARGESLLRARVLALKVSEADRVVRWLLDRGDGPAGALEHLAVRSNAARARFKSHVRAEPKAAEWKDEAAAVA